MLLTNSLILILIIVVTIRNYNILCFVIKSLFMCLIDPIKLLKHPKSQHIYQKMSKVLHTTTIRNEETFLSNILAILKHSSKIVADLEDTTCTVGNVISTFKY